VWPSTTSPQRRKATQLACTQGQREARPVVSDNVDTHGGRLDDRVMQQTQTNYQGGEQNTCQVGMADTCVAKRCVTDTTVLVNAIDWLTRRWNHIALQDKPLAVIGPTEDCYSGAWARHHIEESGRFTETLVIEPITVTNLCEAVTWLAERANITRPTRAGQRYDPGLMTTLTPDMKRQSDFRADSAAEFDVGRLRRQLAKPEARLKEFEPGAEIG
jgi:hypothetical protein